MPLKFPAKFASKQLFVYVIIFEPAATLAEVPIHLELLFPEAHDWHAPQSSTLRSCIMPLKFLAKFASEQFFVYVIISEPAATLAEVPTHLELLFPDTYIDLIFFTQSCRPTAYYCEAHTALATAPWG